MKFFMRRQGSLQQSSFLAGLFVCFALLSSSSPAQLSTASLNGVVRDGTGAVVANASVVLRNVDTAVENRTVSNGAGAYVLVSITPGRYTLAATAPGFGSKQVPDFTLTVGQTATIDFALAVGEQSQVVTVQGSAPLLETSSANLGTVIGVRQVNDLPLNGRNFTSLLLLSPGVAPVNTGQNNGGGFAGPPIANNAVTSFPAINGQTNRSNFFLTDGLNNYWTILSTYAVPPIIDAIQEFKVVSHTDSAEFGSVMGGVVNVVTKSGTNELHGSAWEYARNDIFDARSYFLPKNVAKTPFSQNMFGGSIGGPVMIPKLYNGRNKTFFFGAYQGFRFKQTANNLLKVPTAAQLAGDESDQASQIYDPLSTRPDPAKPGQYIRDVFPNKMIPNSRIDSRMVAWANFIYPKAGPVLDSNGDNALDTTPTTQTQNEFTVRIDQTFGAKDSAWFRYSFINSVNNQSGGLPGLGNITSVPGRNWGGSYVHVFNPSLVLQVQYARTTGQHNETTRFTQSTSNIYNQVGFAAAFASGYLATNGGSLLPNPGIENFTGGGETIQNAPKATDSHQVSGTVTKVLSDHELHFGGGYITNTFASPIGYSNLDFSAQQTGNPEDSTNPGNSMASFLLNVPNSAERRNVNETERPGGVLSAFAQDSWKATKNLTLNFGLRYDLTFIPAYGTDGTIGQQGGIETGDMDLTNGVYVLQKLPPSCNSRGHAPCIPGDGTLPAHVIVDPRGKIPHNVYTNFGPRAGFAYRVTDKTVVRGAFGIVYDNWAAVSQMAQNIEGSWPDIGEQRANNLNQPTTASPTPQYQAQDPFGNNTSSLLPTANPYNQGGYFFDPHIKNPYVEEWNFGIGQELNSSTTMTLNYVGSTAHRLDVGGFYNTALTPGPGDPQPRALYPYFLATNYDRSVGTGNYNALQASVEKRFTGGFSYSLAYTWSKSIDTGGDGWFGVEGGVPQDPYHPDAFGSRSVSGNDVTNDLSISTLYQMPIGKGQRFSTGNSFADYVLGNWQINNIFLDHTGVPFTPHIGSDIANTGNTNGYETLNVVGNPRLVKRTPAEFFNTAAYAVPAAFTFGTAGRNSLRNATYWNLDTSLIRSFPIGEGRQFQFRAEAFNLLNNVVLGSPQSDFNSGKSFGTINSTGNSARVIQLCAKFVF